MTFNKARLREVSPEEWLILDKICQSLATNKVYYISTLASKFYVDPAALLALMVCLANDKLISLNTAVFHCRDEHVDILAGLPYDPYTCPICNKAVNTNSLRYDFAIEVLESISL